MFTINQTNISQQTPAFAAKKNQKGKGKQAPEYCQLPAPSGTRPNDSKKALKTAALLTALGVAPFVAAKPAKALTAFTPVETCPLTLVDGDNSIFKSENCPDCEEISEFKPTSNTLPALFRRAEGHYLVNAENLKPIPNFTDTNKTVTPVYNNLEGYNALRQMKEYSGKFTNFPAYLQSSQSTMTNLAEAYAISDGLSSTNETKAQKFFSDPSSIQPPLISDVFIDGMSIAQGALKVSGVDMNITMPVNHEEELDIDGNPISNNLTCKAVVKPDKISSFYSKIGEFNFAENNYQVIDVYNALKSLKDQGIVTNKFAFDVENPSLVRDANPNLEYQDEKKSILFSKSEDTACKTRENIFEINPDSGYYEPIDVVFPNKNGYYIGIAPKNGCDTLYRLQMENENGATSD